MGSMSSHAWYRVTRQIRERGDTNIVHDYYLPARKVGRYDCHTVVFIKLGEVIQATALSIEDAFKVCESECGAVVSTYKWGDSKYHDREKRNNHI